MKARRGWMEQANAEVLAWAESYRQERETLIARGLFPPVISPARYPILTGPGPQEPTGTKRRRQKMPEDGWLKRRAEIIERQVRDYNEGWALGHRVGDDGMMTQAMQVLTSHETAEWYTPLAYIERVRRVLGWIDLDPASNTTAQTWIQAGRWYGPDHPEPYYRDGLARQWVGRVFLNPPYGKTGGLSNQAVWSRKLIEAYLSGCVSSAILLINSTHGYRWYEDLWTRFPVCLARERISFLRPDGTPAGPAKRGQTFVYLGNGVELFQREFGPLGRVLLPEEVTGPGPQEPTGTNPAAAAEATNGSSLADRSGGV